MLQVTFHADVDNQYTYQVVGKNKVEQSLVEDQQGIDEYQQQYCFPFFHQYFKENNRSSHEFHAIKPTAL